MMTRKWASRGRPAAALAALWPLLWPAAAAGRTISVTPADDYRAIEAAQAGDVVEIAPGTYRFRVNLTQSGAPDRPIVIRAQDPRRRPVWDLSGTPVSDAPGSYTAGDRGRGCWQVRGGHYRIEGIVFRGCVDRSSAGVRVVNVPGVHLRDCLFSGNTNGLTGAGDDLQVEFCEFDRNGDARPGDAPAHSIYIYGGTLTVRFSYFHDSPRGQHFHLRSREALLAYNWFTRPGSYPGDLMTCNYLCGGAAGQRITQRLSLIGNVIAQGSPANPSQVLALLKDEAGSYDGTGDAAALELTLHHNTIIGTRRQPGQSHRVVNLRNDTIATRVEARNNLIRDIAAFAEITQPAASNASVSGAGNWMTAGSSAAGLTDTRFGADPGLGPGLVPLPGSPVIGLAVPLSSPPTFEYHRDEQVTCAGRQRLIARDPGAFESTTMTAPFGPRDPLPGAPPPMAAARRAGTEARSRCRPRPPAAVTATPPPPRSRRRRASCCSACRD
jgi:hypothetical protein